MTGNRINKIESVIYNLSEPGKNKLNPYTLVNGYLNSDGTILAGSSYKTTDFIDVSAFQYGYAINKPFRKFLAYNENKQPITASFIDLDEPAQVVTLDTDYKFIRITLYANNLTNAQVADSLNNIDYYEYCEIINNLYDCANDRTADSIKKHFTGIGKNKLNPNTLVDGFLIDTGAIAYASTYKTTDFIDVSQFQYGYAINVPFRKFLAYDENKTVISGSYIDLDEPAQVVTLDTDYKFIRITLYADNMSDAQVADSATSTEYIPFELIAKDGINYLNEETTEAVDRMIRYSTNMLTNKKWYACGDSFTAGGYSEDGHTFTDEPYKGRTNDFCTSVYQNVGADADYITLKFGINDGNYDVPIGTINDNVDTTYYGAWNKVMTWLITNRPTAKIGIIVSNGLGSNDYAVATIAIANKYGVPYLNEWSGEQVPVLIRSGRTDVSSDIKTIRNETFRVSETNTHPNDICHEYESTFVESWLKTL